MSDFHRTLTQIAKAVVDYKILPRRVLVEPGRDRIALDLAENKLAIQLRPDKQPIGAAVVVKTFHLEATSEYGGRPRPLLRASRPSPKMIYTAKERPCLTAEDRATFRPGGSGRGAR